jgi:hypothetical protein
VQRITKLATAVDDIGDDAGTEFFEGIGAPGEQRVAEEVLGGRLKRTAAAALVKKHDGAVLTGNGKRRRQPGKFRYL